MHNFEVRSFESIEEMLTDLSIGVSELAQIVKTIAYAAGCGDLSIGSSEAFEIEH